MVLNQMLQSWAIQRLMVFTVQRQVFTLNSGVQVATLGPGGTFNAARPPRIERAGVINLNNPAQPLELPLSYINTQKWAGVPVKNIQSPLPGEVWDDNQFPLRNLTFWPVPSVQVQIALYTWAALSTYPDLVVTDIEFPPAYDRAIRYNLAVELAAEFDQENLNPRVDKIATESKAEIKRMNYQPIYLSCDPAVVSPDGDWYNWLTDGPTPGRG